jgi:uncharacterized protein YndB with AHSA1/START domain
MPVHKDGKGRRFVAVEVETPGTPEEVWQAIATGPGISAWFVPTDIEGRRGGAIVSHFGPEPGMDSRATVTEWQPPQRFAAESDDGFAPGAPPLATEWIVENQTGGACIVRVVHSLFADSDEWDEQLMAPEQGWPVFFRILQMYLTEFAGERSATLQIMGASPLPHEAAWKTLRDDLAVAKVSARERLEIEIAGQPFVGTVAWSDDETGAHGLIVRLEQPAPGIAHLYAQTQGDQTYFTLRCFLYGDRGADAAAVVGPLWTAWMSTHFALPALAGAPG